MKSKSLQDLGAMRDALAERERAAAEARRRAEEERARAERERRQFELAVGKVAPLKAAPRADMRLPPPTAYPRQRELDEQRALAEALSDEVDVESLLLTDDGLGFRRPGISMDVLTRLRRGQWSIQGQLDLHGLRRDEAREAVAAFVRHSAQQGQRCLRVVHGKGHGSPGREPVLKSKVQRWLAQRAEVIAFAQASGPQGGAGALIVLLAS
ncbi:MAG TPA: Smr/MutS family protein [Burkholderiaceae bacterium]|nr:Smr/MutS family protein [Burkholderiaceae bacterium]